jgi:hypothetical protein
MEEGHFPELNALFHRIRKHETICDNGEDVYEVLERERLGTVEDENDAHVIDELPIDSFENGLPVDELPNDQGYNNESLEVVVNDDSIDNELTINEENDIVCQENSASSLNIIDRSTIALINKNKPEYTSRQRQTLLFSATAGGIGNNIKSQQMKK